MIGQLSGQVAEDPLLLVSQEGQQTRIYGILEARPEGLSLQMKKGAPLITVAWEKLDLQHLQRNHPEVYLGYRDAREFSEPVLLRLGGFKDILTYNEAVTLLYRGMQRNCYYTLPENVDYLFELDPDVLRMKEHDRERYERAIRDYRRELQDFLRELFPKEAVIISDEGNLHRKERNDLVEVGKGETSLGAIIRYLSDTRHTVSRVGLLYLREVSHFPEDFETLINKAGTRIPNATFRFGNADHMKLPTLLRETRDAVKHLMEAKSIHRGEQYKLGEFYNLIYGQAEAYEDSSSKKNARKFDTDKFPQLDFSEDF